MPDSHMVIVYRGINKENLKICETIKDAKIWVYEHSHPNEAEERKAMFERNGNPYNCNDIYKSPDFKKYMQRGDTEEEHDKFVWKYYDPPVINNEIWVNINTLQNLVVYSEKNTGATIYNFSNVDDIYKISNLGNYRSKSLYPFSKVIGRHINSVKKEIQGVKDNISFLYLLALAFADNPNKYTSAELQQNGIKSEKFFEDFDARRDIAWVPNRFQTNTLDIDINNDSNTYTFEYITEEIEELPNSEFPILSNINVVDQYDSIKDSILEDTWTQIPNYPNYEIDKRGHVKNIITHRILSPCIQSVTGYYRINLQYKSLNIHRLVALTFIPKTDDPMQVTVNHIDGNKLNNNVENLEWASYKEQNIHMCQVLHPDRIFIPMRRSVLSVRNNESFEHLLVRNLFIKKNKLVGIDIDEEHKKIIINDYIYKKELQFDSTTNAAKYFHLLGFPETNLISYNLGKNKDAFGYTWSYIESVEIDDEIWKPLYEVQDSIYNELSIYAAGCEISSYGRFRKNNKITDPTKLKSEDKSFTVKGIKKEYTINVLVALAFIGPRPSKEYLVYHMDGNKNNYNYKNLMWATLSKICNMYIQKNKVI